MSQYVERSGLKVATLLADFIESKVLPLCEISADDFWSGSANIFGQFAPENARLLKRRDELQAEIDKWYAEGGEECLDPARVEEFLRSIGYLVPEPAPFEIGTQNVDVEIAEMAGPQLVVPVLNARFLLNAANARWGSLYDALYGTDALPGQPKPGGYDPERGQQVIARARQFLDSAIPGWGKAVKGEDGAPPHATCEQGFMFKNNGLHIEIHIDPEHPVGKTDPLGISDVLIESALTTIVDLEDSVAAVDAEDKVLAYSNWLGLMTGELAESFQKGGKTVNRTLSADREYRAPSGSTFTLPGRSTLLVRNVGHLMTTPAILLADGSEAPEGILDGIVTSLIATIDLAGKGKYRNSRTGSVYIVKPKMHGPEEVGFTNRLFDAVEDMLGLSRHTLKVGVMDEERRTSANLAACIEAVKDRIIFINTGFLDRTGDEIHTAMRAGAMVPKAEMKASDWITAYEQRNVAVGLACGLSGKAQIGKGMWAAPDRMAEMMEQKIGHPKTGANTAWVPSPTAATLHALHYHEVDVFEVQKDVAARGPAPLEKLLTVPVARGRNWTEEEVARELQNNAQGILGYVVRWIDQGVGCSKVPDINDIGLMEDRATLRISSQHMANWLLHGVCTREDVEQAFRKMAAKVDEQNAGDPLYEKMAGREDESLAYQAALALVLEGVEQPSGYTEPLLHSFRQRKKAQG